MDLFGIQGLIEKLSLDEQNLIFKELYRLVNNMDIDIPKIQITQKVNESRRNSRKIIENGKEHSLQLFSCRDYKLHIPVKVSYEFRLKVSHLD